MIQFSNVSKHYSSGNNALSNINLSVDSGAMAFIAGRSGAGKSTLLKLLGLIERPSNGTMIINGQNVDRIKGDQLALYRRHIGFMFQDHRLLMDRSVFDNVALPLVIAEYRHSDIRKRVQAALDKVGLLQKMNNDPQSLSGGEQQRVGLARAVVHRPSILLADEPTGNLDPALAWDSMQMFEQFNSVGVTVLIASHDMEMVKRLKKRIIILRDGRLISDPDNQSGSVAI